MQQTHQLGLTRAIDLLRECRLAISNSADDPSTLGSLNQVITLVEGAVEATDEDARRGKLLDAILKLSGVLANCAVLAELIRSLLW